MPRINSTAVFSRDFRARQKLKSLLNPELLIRTGGDVRISNFLLWEIAYTELYVTPVLWPDFDKKELLKAIEAYHGRQRRFGRVLEG